MSFVLYFAGTGSKTAKEEIRRLHCNQLLSQLNERRELMDWVEFLRATPDYRGKLFVDSGAYSAYTQGKEINVDDYINLINDIGDVVTVFAAAGLSWDNYLYMIERVKPEYVDKIMPVFHFQEDTKWLKQMLDFTFPDGHHIKYIGLAVSTIDNAEVRYYFRRECVSGRSTEHCSRYRRRYVACGGRSRNGSCGFGS